jgi:hypothetical protein
MQFKISWMKTSPHLLELRLFHSTRQLVQDDLAIHIIGPIRKTFWELPIFKKGNVGPIARIHDSLHTKAPKSIADFMALKFNMMGAIPEYEYEYSV